MAHSTEFEFTGTDRFSLRRRIGAGGMGIVYEVHDRESDTRLALKTLRNVDPQSLYRLKREFRALQDLQHPNLVSLGELIEDGGQWFFTMELVPGQDFLSYVRPGASSMAHGSQVTLSAIDPNRQETVPTDMRSGADRDRPRFDATKLRAALGQLALGLRALHSAGVVHRDIKPSNIQVTVDGRVVLLDFGLAVDTRDGADSTEHHVVGTVAYMAPEQASSKSVGPEADWYSVGILLYESLTGQVPFDGTALSVLMDKQQSEPTPPGDVTPGIPDDLNELCVELLRFDPSERPSGDDVLLRLKVDTTHTDIAPMPSTSATHTPPFVGRHAELQVLRDAFERTRADAAATVLVVGESGVGKTALIRHFTDTLTWESESIVRLRGRCYERETVPYKGLDGVVDALSRYMRRLPRARAASLLPRNASLLPRVFPILGRVDVIAGAPRPPQEVVDPRELRNRVFAALRELLLRLAEAHPLVVVIDDLQWADADSMLLLGELIRDPDPPPLLLVASVRDGAKEILARVPGEVARVDLERLPPREAHELAERLLERRNQLREGVAQAIAEEAAGHPLFIDELVRHVSDTDDQHRVQLRLDDAILARVDRLERRAARLLELVCVSGAPISQAVVCHAAQTTLADASRALAALRVANLVRGARGGDRIEPYHDRIRKSVTGRLDDDQRRSCHGRLAIALEAADQPIRYPEMLVYHLEAAGRVAEATQRAEQAARRARKGVAFDRSAELYRTALRLGDYDPEKRRQLLIRLGEALANAGRGLQSAKANIAATEGADPTTRLECQRRAAEQLLISGHIEEGLEALEAVLAGVGERLPKTPTRALMSVIWGRSRLWLRGLRFKERHESEISARDLTRVDVYRSVAHGLGVVDTIRGVDFQIRGLRLALDTGEPLRIGHALLEGAGYLAVQGGAGVDRGRVLINTAADIAERVGDANLLALTPGVDGLASYYEGKLRIAVERLNESETRFVEQTLGATWELNTVRLFKLFVLRRLGAFAELGQCFDNYVRDAMRRGDHHMETSVRWSCNDIWLARDDVDSARRDLDNTPWLPPEGRFHLQHFYELRARAELDMYTGAAKTTLERLAGNFRELRKSMLLRIMDIRAETNYVLARCALVMGDTVRATKLARALRKDRVCYAVAWSLLTEAGVLATDGDDDGARRKLRETVLYTEQSEMAMLAAVARRRLGELTGGVQGAAYIEEATTFMAAQAIVNPARITQLLAPGFGAHGSISV